MPDGYTLLFALSSNTINASLYDNLSFDFLRDIAPVASIDRVPLVMEVNPSMPARTVPEFIAYAKANPGKLNMASGGNGSPQHLAGELFQMLTGVSMLHVPYKGAAPALTDLVAGQVQVMFDVLVASIELHTQRQGCARWRLHARRAAPSLPDVPLAHRCRPRLRGERLARESGRRPRDRARDHRAGSMRRFHRLASSTRR